MIKRPWPGMLRTVYGDPDRYVKNYWSQIPGMYFTGDGARRDKDGYFWIMGRVDDVLNVSGHRLSTMEVESALVAHPAVAEAAVVGRPDELKGQAISAFVTLEHGSNPHPNSKKNCGSGWRKKSERWPSRMTFALPTCFRKRAAGKSCGGCCVSWRPTAA